MKQDLFYHAVALVHANKVGGEMLSDFESVLKNSGDLTVSQLLNMTGADYLQRNATMGTTQIAFGKEFVEEKVLSAELIDRLRNSDSILTKAMFRNMSASTQLFPVRGARVRMRAGSETVTDPTGVAPAGQIKRAGTAELSLTAKKLIITINYSDELLEDSLVAIAEFIMTEIQDAYERSLHEIILNGDVTTGATVNINAIDGNTSALPDGNSTDALLFDGVRKTAFTKLTALDAVGVLDVAKIRALRSSMGLKGMNPADLVMVPDQATYFKIMSLGQVETIEKFGDAATIKNGVLVAIDGIAIANREEMPATLASGKTSLTPASNVKGSIALIHMPSVNVGFRRALTTESSRNVQEQVTGITASARVAVTIDDTQNTTKATAPCALLFNI